MSENLSLKQIQDFRRRIAEAGNDESKWPSTDELHVAIEALIVDRSLINDKPKKKSDRAPAQVVDLDDLLSTDVGG